MQEQPCICLSGAWLVADQEFQMKDRDRLGTYKQNVYKSEDSRTERSGLHRQMRKGQCKKEKKKPQKQNKTRAQILWYSQRPRNKEERKGFSLASLFGSTLKIYPEYGHLFPPP